MDRRSRVASFVKQTVSQVSQYYPSNENGASSRTLSFSSITTSSTSTTSSSLPASENTELLLYPAFSHYAPNENNWKTHIYGWLFIPGTMNRKNRLIYTIMKQLVGINQQNSYLEPTLKERFSPFIAKYLPNVDLILMTDNNEDSFNLSSQDGFFHHTITTTKKPNILCIKTRDELVISPSTQVYNMNNAGIGIISDIDDTIKDSGILGDKRTLLRNIFIKDVKKGIIDGVLDWYNYLNTEFHDNISFHYVSNSPYQLRYQLTNFLNLNGFPKGTLNLKKYALSKPIQQINSLFEPSHEKKKLALYKLLNDFPNKKFLLIGDSGEYDLEAYIDLANKFPKQILGIFIHLLKIESWDGQMIWIDGEDGLSTNDVFYKPLDIEIENNSTTNDLIDLNSSSSPLPSNENVIKKLPPKVPKKPSNFKSVPTRKPPPSYPSSISTSISNPNPISSTPPQLPPRRPSTVPPLPPRRVQTETAINFSSNLNPSLTSNHIYRSQTIVEESPKSSSYVSSTSTNELQDNLEKYDLDYDQDELDVDKRIENWKRRVSIAKRDLPKGIKLKFWINGQECIGIL